MAADAVPSVLDAFLSRADLADLALLIWAMGASAAALVLLRELGAANRRFDDFVRELHRFNARHQDD